MANSPKPHVRCTLSAAGKQHSTDSPNLEARTHEDQRKLDKSSSPEATEAQADGNSSPTRYLAEQAQAAAAESTD